MEWRALHCLRAGVHGEPFKAFAYRMRVVHARAGSVGRHACYARRHRSTAHAVACAALAALRMSSDEYLCATYARHSESSRHLTCRDSSGCVLRGGTARLPDRQPFEGSCPHLLVTSARRDMQPGRRLQISVVSVDTEMAGDCSMQRWRVALSRALTTARLSAIASRESSATTGASISSVIAACIADLRHADEGPSYDLMLVCNTCGHSTPTKGSARDEIQTPRHTNATGTSRRVVLHPSTHATAARAMQPIPWSSPHPRPLPWAGNSARRRTSERTVRARRGHHYIWNQKKSVGTTLPEAGRPPRAQSIGFTLPSAAPSGCGSPLSPGTLRHTL